MNTSTCPAVPVSLFHQITSTWCVLAQHNLFKSLLVGCQSLCLLHLLVNVLSLSGVINLQRRTRRPKGYWTRRTRGPINWLGAQMNAQWHLYWVGGRRDRGIAWPGSGKGERHATKDKTEHRNGMARDNSWIRGSEETMGDKVRRENWGRRGKSREFHPQTKGGENRAVRDHKSFGEDSGSQGN